MVDSSPQSHLLKLYVCTSSPRHPETTEEKLQSVLPSQCSPLPGILFATRSLWTLPAIHFGVFRAVSTPVPLFHIFLALPVWDDRLQHVKAGRIFVLISKCCRLRADVPRIPQTYVLTFIYVLCWAACEPGNDLYLLIACTLVDLQLKISGLFFNYKWFILSRCMELKLHEAKRELGESAFSFCICHRHFLCL